MSKRWEKTKQPKQFQLAPKKCYMEAYEKHLVRETMRELTQDVVEEPSYTYLRHPWVTVQIQDWSVIAPNHIVQIKVTKDR